MTEKIIIANIPNLGNVEIPEAQWSKSGFFKNLIECCEDQWPRSINLREMPDFKIEAFLSMFDYMTGREGQTEKTVDEYDMCSWSTIIPNRFKSEFDNVENIDITNPTKVEEFRARYLTNSKFPEVIIDIHNLPEIIVNRFKEIFPGISPDDLIKKYMKFMVFEHCLVDVLQVSNSMAMYLNGEPETTSKIFRDKFDDLFTMIAQGDEVEFLSLRFRTPEEKVQDAKILREEPAIESGEYYEPGISVDDRNERFKLCLEFCFKPHNTWLCPPEPVEDIEPMETVTTVSGSS